MSDRVEPSVRTTVVVVTWRGEKYIDNCLDALARQQRAHNVLVIDNASTDGTADRLSARSAQFTLVKLEKNVGYAGGIAAALPLVRTPFLAWLNDDASPEPHWLAELEDTLDAHPDVAAVSARLLHRDGELQSCGVRLTASGYGADQLSCAEPFGFCGGAALTRASALREIGGVPAYFFCYYEDTDTSWRLRLAGWRIMTASAAVARHLHGASTQPGSAQFHHWNERNRLMMLLRCAPLAVALWQLLLFALRTLWLSPRQQSQLPSNFQRNTRLIVLADVCRLLPSALRERRTYPGADRRRMIWRTWAGRG